MSNRQKSSEILIWFSWKQLSSVDHWNISAIIKLLLRYIRSMHASNIGHVDKDGVEDAWKRVEGGNILYIVLLIICLYKKLQSIVFWWMHEIHVGLQILGQTKILSDPIFGQGWSWRCLKKGWRWWYTIYSPAYYMLV